MKKFKLLLFLFFIFSFFACKQTDKEEEKISVSHSQGEGNAAEAQKRLDEKLAHTEKIWDSLSHILKRTDLEANYRDSIKALYVENKNEQSEIYKTFVQENLNSKISIGIINGFKFKWGKEITKKLYYSLEPGLRNSKDGEQVKKYLTYYNNLQLNDLYPDFELVDSIGDTKKISEYRTNYTLLEFWASWCTSCRKKHPELIKLYNKYKNNDFTIIGISGDRSSVDWKRALEQDNLPWINLIDTLGRESIVQYKYGITVLPTNFLIGPDGKIVGKDFTPEEIEEVLKKK